MTGKAGSRGAAAEGERRDTAIRALLRDAIDYAGLFPPAGLPMAAAVEHYARYLRSPDAWALGRFVVPAARLTEMAMCAAALTMRAGEQGVRWRVSALVGDVDAELPLIEAFNAARGVVSHDVAGEAVVDTVELRASTVDEVSALAQALAGAFTAYVEVPVAEDPTELVAAIGRVGLHAKIRTGGVTPEAFPSPEAVARFLAACVAHGVPFKATAGLHHPLRAEYRLTYAPDSVRAPMYGFLNVFLATALLRAGGSVEDAAALLDEYDPRAITVSREALCWRAHRWDVPELEALRAQLAGFGSCSFREPLDDLTALGFL